MIRLAWQNGFAERVIHTLQENEVDLSELGGCHA